MSHKRKAAAAQLNQPTDDDWKGPGSPISTQPLHLLALCMKFLTPPELIVAYKTNRLLQQASSHPFTFQHGVEIGVRRNESTGFAESFAMGPRATFKNLTPLSKAFKGNLFRHFRLLTLATKNDNHYVSAPVEPKEFRRWLDCLIQPNSPPLRALTLDLRDMVDAVGYQFQFRSGPGTFFSFGGADPMETGDTSIGSNTAVSSCALSEPSACQPGDIGGLPTSEVSTNSVPPNFRIAPSLAFLKCVHILSSLSFLEQFIPALPPSVEILHYTRTDSEGQLNNRIVEALESDECGVKRIIFDSHSSAEWSPTVAEIKLMSHIESIERLEEFHCGCEISILKLNEIVKEWKQASESYVTAAADAASTSSVSPVVHLPDLPQFQWNSLRLAVPSFRPSPIAKGSSVPSSHSAFSMDGLKMFPRLTNLSLGKFVSPSSSPAIMKTLVSWPASVTKTLERMTIDLDASSRYMAELVIDSLSYFLSCAGECARLKQLKFKSDQVIHTPCLGLFKSISPIAPFLSDIALINVWPMDVESCFKLLPHVDTLRMRWPFSLGTMSASLNLASAFPSLTNLKIDTATEQTPMEWFEVLTSIPNLLTLQWKQLKPFTMDELRSTVPEWRREAAAAPSTGSSSWGVYKTGPRFDHNLNESSSVNGVRFLTQQEQAKKDAAVKQLETIAAMAGPSPEEIAKWSRIGEDAAPSNRLEVNDFDDRDDWSDGDGTPNDPYEDEYEQDEKMTDIQQDQSAASSTHDGMSLPSSSSYPIEPPRKRKRPAESDDDD